MIIRDKVAKNLLEDGVADLEQINNDKQLFELFIEKIEYHLQKFKKYSSLEDLAEIEEIIEFLKIFFGFSNLDKIREKLKKENGLYWKKYNLIKVNKIIKFN